MINELFKIFSGHPGVVLYNVLQIVNIFAGYDGEAKSPMPYSKFAHDFASRSPKKEFMVPSRLGMLTIYLPAMITVMMYLFALPLVSGNVKPGLACWMLLVHFVKRNLEVLFLHKYSGSTPLNAAILIGFVYALASLMICSVSSPIPCEACSHVGQAFFYVGSLGNLYHHYLLASLRSKAVSSRKYLAPRGGLFDYAAAPHYLFELIAWAGIAIASQQLTGYLNLLSMTGYLLARSRNQNNWNKNKFDGKEWPESRKNLIPFLY